MATKVKFYAKKLRRKEKKRDSKKRLDTQKIINYCNNVWNAPRAAGSGMKFANTGSPKKSAVFWAGFDLTFRSLFKNNAVFFEEFRNWACIRTPIKKSSNLFWLWVGCS